MDDPSKLDPPNLDEIIVSPAKVEKEDSVEDEIFESISAQQMRYVQLAVNTGMTRHQIAASMNVTVNMLTQWDKDPIVSRYMTAYKKEVSKHQIQQAASQSRILNDLAFTEMMSRFKMNDEDRDKINDPAIPINIRLQIMRKYAEGSTFRDVLESVKVLGKQYRDDIAVDGDQEEDMIVEKVRKTYMRKRFQDDSLQNEFKEAGLDLSKGWAELVSNDSGVTFTEAQRNDDQVVEEIVQEIERKSIFKRRKNVEEEE